MPLGHILFSLLRRYTLKMEKQVFANLFWWSARCRALVGHGRMVYKRAISPSVDGEIAREEALRAS